MVAGVNASSFPDGKIPKELEGISTVEFEKNKMENLL
jgi:hypothetical protein